MTKQEFLAFSLPYDVKAIDKFECIWIIHPYKDALDTLEDNEHLSYENFIKEDGHKLILRHLSDLTKEIEHKGEKFNPYYKLGLETVSGIEFYKPSNSDLEINIETPNYSTQIDLYSGFLIVQKLIEWHFDIANLISKGEAIDVNTLETNPYK